MTIDKELLKIIIPLIAVLLTAINLFITNFRKENILKADDTLNNYIGPLYHSLLKYWSSNIAIAKTDTSTFYIKGLEYLEELLKEIHIYGIRDFSLVRRINFVQIKIEENNINYKKEFIELSRSIEKEYWKLLILTSSNFNWRKNTILFPLWLQILYALFRFMYKFTYYIMVLTTLAVTIMIYLYLTSDIEIQSYLFYGFISLTLVGASFYALNAVNLILIDTTGLYKPSKNQLPIHYISKNYKKYKIREKLLSIVVVVFMVVKLKVTKFKKK